MKNLFLLLSFGLFLVSCDSDDSTTNESTTANLSVNLSGLEDLGSDYVYEGWIIVDGSPVTTGTFTVDANNTPSQTTFTVDAEQLNAASAFVLSIEPAADPDPAPAATKLLSGGFDGNTATVSIADQVGDFANADGTFFLRTPTDEPDGMNNGNDENGVWFGTPGAPPTPNLNVPSLAPGWVYEGWVVVDGVGPISTGQFANASVQMGDDAAPFSSDLYPSPPVPGEDFFLNAPVGVDFPLDVRGRTVVVSVEPFPDNSPAPFAIKPLVGVAGQETAPSSHGLSLNAASFPTGTVTR